MSLYNSTGGKQWRFRKGNGWGKAGVALGKWKGVTVDKANNVVTLDLSFIGLNGTTVRS